MAETHFPIRQRCKKCGKGFGNGASAQVYFGLFCTPRCAGIATPPTRAEDAPRECKTQRDGTAWVFKRRYRSVSEIPSKLRDDPTVSHYSCQSCGGWHIGHSRIDLTREQHRVLVDRKEVADLLVKARGHATHRQVAEVAKVRPIRIKELEDPAFADPSLAALFAVLAVYRLKLAAVFPQERAGRR
jgi:phage FluMu protein Com